MATGPFVKQGTGVTQTSEEELKKLGKQAGVQPLSPAGAVALGANQDQAKMAGSKARKDAVLAPGTEPAAPQPQKQTLQQAQRTQPQGTTEATQEQQHLNEPASAKLERMNTLGSLNMQMENLVAQKLAAAQQQSAQLQINQQAVATTPQAQQAGVQAALQAFQGAQTEAQKEAAILAASNALGRLVTPAEMQSFFQAAPDAVAGTITPEAVTVASLGLENTAQLAQDLGVSETELLAFSPDQLKASIQNLESRDFNRIQALQAQLQGATGNTREAIAQELRTLGAAGTASTEADFDSLQSAVDAADTITFNGQPQSVEDLLSDDGISNTLMTALENPAAMQELEKNEPELAAWAKQHAAALGELVKDVRGQTEAVGATQEAAALSRAPVSAKLFESIFGAQEKFTNREQQAQREQDLANSPLWQALLKDGDLKGRLERSPELATRLKGLTAANIAGITDATKALELDGNLAKLAGYTPGGLASDAQVALANEWAPTMQKLPPTVSGDEAFLKAVQEKALDASDAQRLIEQPQLWDKVKEDKIASDAIAMAGSDPDKLLDVYFGADVDMGEFNKGIQQLEAYARMGDKDAQDKYTWIKKNLAGDNGRIGPEDVALMQQLGKSGGMKNVIGGKGSFADIVAGTKKNLAPASTFQSSDTSKRAAMPYIADDMSMSDAEATDMANRYGEAEFRKLLASPWADSIMPTANKWREEYARRDEDRNYVSYLDNFDSSFVTSLAQGAGNVLPGLQLDRASNSLKYNIDPAGLSEAKYNTARQQVDAKIKDVVAKINTYKDKGSARNAAYALMSSLIRLNDDLEKAYKANTQPALPATGARVRPATTTPTTTGPGKGRGK